MICYRDRTFCTESTCSKHLDCDKFLTQEIIENAMLWWGNDQPPICLYVSKPNCYIKRINKDAE